jgi:hypothetical protein
VVMTTEVERTAEDVHDSAAMEWLARLGLAARGVVWLVIGLLAASVLLGHDEQTDRQGALRAIADKPFGEALLVVLVVGFAGYALWRALAVAVGHRDDDGAKRTGKRLLSAGKAVLYGSLAVSTLRFLLDGGSAQSDQTSSRTAKVMAATGGRWLVGVVGVAVVAAGVVMVVRAAQGKHMKKLESYRLDADRTKVAKVVGTAGLSGRGLVLALVGAFLVRAAWQFDPGEAKGLDAALATLAGQAYGKTLLAIAVLCLLAYAAWSFLEAAWRKI